MSTLELTARRFDLAAISSRPGFRLNLLFIALVLIYAVAVNVAAYFANADQHIEFRLYSEVARMSAVLAGVLFFIGYCLHLTLVRRVARPVSEMMGDIRRYLLNPMVVLMVATPFLMLPVFMSMFTSFKSLIPVLHPFSMDATFAEIDRLLHGGIEPWRLTHALFGHPVMTVAINFAYNAWFFVMWIFVYGQMLRVNRDQERMHYLVAYVLCWGIIGSFFAVLLSSAGPCFYDRVLPHADNPFAELMANLHALNASLAEEGKFWAIWSLTIQDNLWAEYTASVTHLGSGISAMPSMHVSIAVLMAFGAFRIRRWFGWVMTAYAVVIQIGSVHLGWHYAIDGYLAAILTIGVWYLSGYLVKRVAGSK